MVKSLATDFLEPIKTNEFLPPVSRWVTAGSWFIVLALGGAIASSFLVNYRTTVKVPAVIRPTGEPRLVQSIATGTVAKINVGENESVKKGDIIAALNTSSLDAQAVQLLSNFDQGKVKLQQITAQMATVDQQMAAEVDQAERTVAASAADFDQVRRLQQNLTVTAEADVQEAQAQINLAAQEVESYGQLVASGAVSRLQLAEKESALAAAQARMVRLQAALNPSDGEVLAAQQRIAQAKARGTATLAGLQQSKQQLAQQAIEIQQQLKMTEQEIAQVMLGLQNAVVRSPVDGVLYELSVRNIGQVLSPGETIAKIIPAAAPIEIKAKVPAQQISKVTVGMAAQMRVSACPFSEYGTVPGKVTAISPDTLTQVDASGGSPAAAASALYSVLIQPSVTVLNSTAGNPQCSLQPGTEGRVTIISREETVITFLRRKVGLLTQF
jgi:HlyD family type I secretion membrane fusion protein